MLLGANLLRQARFLLVLFSLQDAALEKDAREVFAGDRKNRITI